jgi:hypothetical protein
MRLLPRFLPSGVHTQRLSALRAQHPSNRCKRFTQLALENYNCMSPKAQTTGLKRAGDMVAAWVLWRRVDAACAQRPTPPPAAAHPQQQQ